ncbi:MAG: zinc-binding dehydrogenase [Polyangiaceae bacterium]|nr:zinc-binding dehydrogenase [Polyangiaceae bacterium]MBK8942741.1 zinc-binding dehydrogenase [Polyangiaceae bacterium]
MSQLAHQTIPIKKFGPPSVLAIETQPGRAVGDDEVAIDVRYSGINFADLQMRLGFYPDAPKRPFVPGYEVSGLVSHVGKNVTDFSPGDPVIAGTYFGGYASSVTLPAHQVFPLPSSMDLASGAALPVAFFTAHLALFEMGRIRKGDRVLIECATGGVGTLAVQMARHVGAEVVGLTSTPSKKGYIAELGATPMTAKELEADTSVAGFDFILNASGGRAVSRQLDRLAMTGRMVCMGLNSGVKDGKRDFLRLGWAALTTPRLPVFSLMNRNAGVFGLNALHVLRDPTWVKKLTERFADVSTMGLHPHVSKVFSAGDVASAHEFIAKKQAVGKVLLEWS